MHIKFTQFVAGTALATMLGGGMTSAAFASSTPSVTLTMRGSVSMGACAPTFDNAGKVDFGKISLGPGYYTDLGTKTLNLTVSCTTAKRVGFYVTDNAKDSTVPNLGTIPANNMFGLGKLGSGTPIGNYSIKFTSVTLDGTQGSVLSSDDSGQNWGLGRDGGLAQNVQTTYWGAAPAGTANAPGTASTYVYSVDVDAQVQDAATLRVTDNDYLNGTATVTLVYL